MGGRLADNPYLLHLEELGLGGGKLVWVQAAGFGKYWRARDSWEVMEIAMLWSGGLKTIRGADVWLLQEKIPDLP